MLLPSLYIIDIPNNPNTPRMSPMIVGASRAILDANEGINEYGWFGYSLVCQKQIEQSSGNRGRSDRLGSNEEKQNAFVART